MLYDTISKLMYVLLVLLVKIVCRSFTHNTAVATSGQIWKLEESGIII